MTLASADKEKIKRVIPKGSNKVIAAAVCRLYIAYPDPNSWTYTGLSGAIVLCDDLVGHTFFLKLVDITGARGVLWDQELWVGFEYNQDRSFFHSFELKDCLAGFLFDDTSDAAQFFKKLTARDKHGSKKTVQNRNAIALKPASGPSAPGHRGEFQNSTSASNSQRFRQTTNVLYYDDLPPPEWRSLYSELEQAGITEDMIADNKEFIKDYINKQGGPLVGLEPPVPRKYTQNSTQDATPSLTPSSSFRKKAPPPPPPGATENQEHNNYNNGSSGSSSSQSTPQPSENHVVHHVPPPLAQINTGIYAPQAHPGPPLPPSSARPQPPSLPNQPRPQAFQNPLINQNRPTPPPPPQRANGQQQAQSRPAPPAPPPRRGAAPAPPPSRGSGRQGPPPPPRRQALPMQQTPQQVPQVQQFQQPAVQQFQQPAVQQFQQPAVQQFQQPAVQQFQQAQAPQFQQQNAIPVPPPLPQAASAPPPAPPLLSTTSVPPPAPAFPPALSSSAAAAPPAPPPPPDLGSGPTPALPVVDGGRDALLSSIRGAGLHTLKKTDKSQLEKPSVLLQEQGGAAPASNAGPVPPGGGGSLADALAAALSNRKNKVSRSDDESDGDW